MKKGIVLLCLVLFVLTLSLQSCGQKPNNYLFYANKEQIDNKFTETFYKNISIDIAAPSNENDNTATVKVRIPDIKEIYLENKDAFSSSDDVDDMQKMISGNMKDFYVEYDLTLEVKKGDSGWELESTDEIDAIINSSIDDFLCEVLKNSEWSNMPFDEIPEFEVGEAETK